MDNLEVITCEFCLKEIELDNAFNHYDECTCVFLGFNNNKYEDLFFPYL